MFLHHLLLGIVTLIASPVFATETPLNGPFHHEIGSYKLKWPVRNVAIIGAGPGGLLSYREFIKAGFDVHLFERDYIPAGNWHYTEETPVDAPIPNAEIAIADFTPSLPPPGVVLPFEQFFYGKDSKELRRSHRAPKPIWSSLHSNAPAPVQEFAEIPWPKGTDWELPHTLIGRYVRTLASFHGINSNDDNPRVSFNTRVELIEKRYDEFGEEAGWTLTLKEIVPIGKDSTKAVWYKRDFDAVVIASGRYNAPNIPSIPGLDVWNQRFPGRLRHSRQYRHPEPYAGQKVLIIGAANSGGEIARELSTHVKHVYVSVRPDNASRPHFALNPFLRRLPANATLVPEIKRFLPPATHIEDSGVELYNGTIIYGIDSVIFGTGYRYTFPFLPHYINSSVATTDVNSSPHPRPIVTDGTHLRSLWLDLFYIEEPTLGFINMNMGIQSFRYPEYEAVALAKVWSGTAFLPSQDELWRQHKAHVEQLGGYGKHFQFVSNERSNEIFKFLLGWLNNAAFRYGGRTIDGLSPELPEISKIWRKARFGSDIFDGQVNLTLLDILPQDHSSASSGLDLEDSIALYNDRY